ncbi:MAG: FHA domain-containing protein [Bacteroidota bacterium]
MGRLRATSQICIRDHDISRDHAAINWEGDGWYLRDKSRNGTTVGMKYLQHDSVKLVRGDTIKFGKCQETFWEVLDTSPPACYFQSVFAEEEVMSLTACPGIPNPEDERVSFFFDQLQWMVERDGDTQTLEHGMIVEIQGKPWKFIENEDLVITRNNASVASQAVFVFRLSLDEERVALKIKMNAFELDLGERVYHHLLLALARKRLADFEMGYDMTELGWAAIEDVTYDLSKEFRREVDAYYLNVQIYRLRKQLLESEPLGYMFSNIIERRRGEIRFAAPHFQIIKEGQCINEMQLKISA